MPKYLIHGSYTLEGIQGVLKEGGSSRVAAVEAAFKPIGGRVEAFYFTFGAYDAFCIADFPDNVTAAAVAMGIAATGTARTTTTVLLTPQEIDRVVKVKIPYRAAGRDLDQLSRPAKR